MITVTALTTPVTADHLTGTAFQMPTSIAAAIPSSDVYRLLSSDTLKQVAEVYINVTQPAAGLRSPLGLTATAEIRDGFTIAARRLSIAAGDMLVLTVGKQTVQNETTVVICAVRVPQLPAVLPTSATDTSNTETYKQTSTSAAPSQAPFAYPANGAHTAVQNGWTPSGQFANPAGHSQGVQAAKLPPGWGQPPAGFPPQSGPRPPAGAPVAHPGFPPWGMPPGSGFAPPPRKGPDPAGIGAPPVAQQWQGQPPRGSTFATAATSQPPHSLQPHAAPQALQPPPQWGARPW